MGMKGALALWLKKNGNMLGRAAKDALPSVDDVAGAAGKAVGYGKGLAEHGGKRIMKAAADNPKSAMALAAGAGAGAASALGDDDEDDKKKKKKKPAYLED